MARQQPLRAVVPYVHLHDLAAAHHKTINIAVALEWRTVRPFPIEGADAVDNRLPAPRYDVRALHRLLHPLVAPGVERRALPRVREFAPTRECQLERVADIERGRLRIRDHRRNKKLDNDLGR